MNSRGETKRLSERSESPESVRVFRHLFRTNPDIVAGEIDMLPATRGQMDQHMIGGRQPGVEHDLDLFPQGRLSGQTDRFLVALMQLCTRSVNEGVRYPARLARTHDMIEFTVLRACAELGRHDELHSLLARRRKGPGPVPVAGVH